MTVCRLWMSSIWLCAVCCAGDRARPVHYVLLCPGWGACRCSSWSGWERPQARVPSYAAEQHMQIYLLKFLRLLLRNLSIFHQIVEARLVVIIFLFWPSFTRRRKISPTLWLQIIGKQALLVILLTRHYHQMRFKMLVAVIPIKNPTTTTICFHTIIHRYISKKMDVGQFTS